MIIWKLVKPVGYRLVKDVFLNYKNNHTIDEVGREFDENGVMVYDPNESV